MTSVAASDGLPLHGRTALVTGASSGIGRAIACAASAHGAYVWLIGRDAERLEQTRALLANPEQARCVCVDIADAQAVADLEQSMPPGEPDILVNCAGLYTRGSMAQSGVGDVDALFKVNVLGVYDLTRALLERLVRAQGDIVFINSSIVHRATADTSLFAATQAALRAVANSLREEVNDRGVRVLSIYPGRTATPRQARIFKFEGREYTPERLLQAEDVAASVLACLALPRTAEVTDLHIRPASK